MRIKIWQLDPKMNHPYTRLLKFGGLKWDCPYTYMRIVYIGIDFNLASVGRPKKTAKFNYTLLNLQKHYRQQNASTLTVRF